MTNKELIAKIASETSMTQIDVARVLEGFANVVTKGIASGDKVVVNGIGSFELKEKAERVGHNPATGEQITIAASKAVTFKATKSLKDYINK